LERPVFCGVLDEARASGLQAGIMGFGSGGSWYDVGEIMANHDLYVFIFGDWRICRIQREKHGVLFSCACAAGSMYTLGMTAIFVLIGCGIFAMFTPSVQWGSFSREWWTPQRLGAARQGSATGMASRMS